LGPGSAAFSSCQTSARTRKRFIALTKSTPGCFDLSKFPAASGHPQGFGSMLNNAPSAAAAPKNLPETTLREFLMSPASNKIALFIDGANLYATAKTLGFDIDYKRLLKEFQSRGTLVRAFYYTAIIEDQEYSSIRPLIDWLDYNGYTVVTKATKEFIDASGRRKVKGNMDIELAVDAMELAEHVDQIVLFSGDGDFRSLVEAVQRRGVRVTVISTISSQPPMIADELRRQADVFTDLVELQSKLGRDPSERPAPREPRHHAPQFLQRATTLASRGDGDDFDD
jgi:uncharacterized LabA/DUF88 family protein